MLTLETSDLEIIIAHSGARRYKIVLRSCKNLGFLQYDSRNPMVLALNIIFNVILLGECVFTYGAMDKMSQHESAHHHVLNPTLVRLATLFLLYCMMLLKQKTTEKCCQERIFARFHHTKSHT